MIWLIFFFLSLSSYFYGFIVLFLNYDSYGGFSFARDGMEDLLWFTIYSVVVMIRSVGTMGYFYVILFAVLKCNHLLFILVSNIVLATWSNVSDERGSR